MEPEHDPDQSEEPSGDPVDTAELITLAIFLSIVVGFFLVEVVRNYEPIKLSVPFLLGFWIVQMVIHELGRALIAGVMGWRIDKLVVGFGREMGRFRLVGIDFECRMFPVECFVQIRPTNLVRPQLKGALTYIAGPAVNLLSAVVVLLVLGSDQLFTRTDDLIMMLWQCLALAGVAQGILNLVPHGIQGASDSIPNDGLGIYQSLRRRNIDYAPLLDVPKRDDN